MIIRKMESYKVIKPEDSNWISEPDRITIRVAQGILNMYGLILKLECGQRVKEGSRKMCRGRVRLTSKGNLRCSVCKTKWIV